MANQQPKEDFLKVDKPIPGQNFVCMSFISPEDVIENKERFLFHSYICSKYKDKRSIDEFNVEYENFIETNKEKLESTFKKKSNYRTSIRGIKIRGVYDSIREAEVRAKVLQRIDKNFHVYVAQMGYWLPWNPNVDKIDGKYDEEQLNELVGKYEENQTKKDAFYEKETEERKKACRDENLRLAEEARAQAEEDSNKNDDDEQTIHATLSTASDANTSQIMSVESILDAINSTDNHEDVKKQFENFNVHDDNNNE